MPLIGPGPFCGLAGQKSPRQFQPSKISFRAITVFLTAHCRLREHLRTLGLEEDITCKFYGEDPEASHHILLKCYAVYQRRLNTLGYQLTVEEISRIDPLKVLKFLKNKFWYLI